MQAKMQRALVEQLVDYSLHPCILGGFTLVCHTVYYKLDTITTTMPF